MSNNTYCKSCVHYDNCEDGYINESCGGYRNKGLMCVHINFEDYEFVLETLDGIHRNVMQMRKSSKRDELEKLIHQAIKILKGEFTLKCD